MLVQLIRPQSKLLLGFVNELSEKYNTITKSNSGILSIENFQKSDVKLDLKNQKMKKQTFSFNLRSVTVYIFSINYILLIKLIAGSHA